MSQPSKYQITSDAYYVRAQQALDVHAKSAFVPALFYAALEFRCCIERILFEYLILVNNESAISKTLEKRYLAKDLKKAILRLEPEFPKIGDFINLYLRALHQNDRVHPVNLDKITRLYGRLGRHLHAQKHPTETCEKPRVVERIRRVTCRNQHLSH